MNRTVCVILLSISHIKRPYRILSTKEIYRRITHEPRVISPESPLSSSRYYFSESYLLSVFRRGTVIIDRPALQTVLSSDTIRRSRRWKGNRTAYRYLRPPHPHQSQVCHGLRRPKRAPHLLGASTPSNAANAGISLDPTRLACLLQLSRIFGLRRSKLPVQRHRSCGCTNAMITRPSPFLRCPRNPRCSRTRDLHHSSLHAM